MCVQWDGTVGKWDYFDYWAHEGEDGEQRLGEDEEGDDEVCYGTRQQRRVRRSQRLKERQEKVDCCFNKLYD